MALALDWVSRITTIALMMVLPGIAGYWVDGKLGTRALFALLGFGLGMFVGMWQLIKQTRNAPGGTGPVGRGDKHDDDNG